MLFSYFVIVDCARMLEMKEMEICTSQKMIKKAKTKSTYSGQSNSTSSIMTQV